ncbi:MAG: hypothetical protein A3G75_06245 [Verrucomicrobia bacterium RIFCSPLOWO2_12_FULL_64_8]|nr:MAG: hypothetical protein A3G75_06245 [Verrucomicrobia bacterium RIFCSPLOWO2_12_FULL_64_8]
MDWRDFDIWNLPDPRPADSWQIELGKAAARGEKLLSPAGVFAWRSMETISLLEGLCALGLLVVAAAIAGGCVLGFLVWLAGSDRFCRSRKRHTGKLPAA